jgi:hypothetical protein
MYLMKKFIPPTTPDEKYPPDGFHSPEWLRYSRTACFDGYSPPLYPDVNDFDAQKIIDLALEIGADTLRFQPVGYWAYYPSQIFPVDPELGGRDLINEVSVLCRKSGLHLYCYTGYGHPFLPEGYLLDHPEMMAWVCLDPQGKPTQFESHYGSAKRHKICRLGKTYRGAIRQVVRELCEHDVDGVYFDGPHIVEMYATVCFCEACQRLFHEKTRLDLFLLAAPEYGGPRQQNLEALQAWVTLIQKTQEEDLLDFRQIIHGSGKFMLFHNGSTWDGKALPYQYRIPDGFMVEYSPQIYQRLTRGMMGASFAKRGKKLAQAYTGSYNTGEPPHLSTWAVHNSNLEDGDEILMEGLANLAAGNMPMYCMLNRMFYNIGSGSAKPIQEVFDLMRRAEPFLKDSVPVSSVTVVPSFDTIQSWRAGRTDCNLAMSESFVLAMLDEHIAFDVLPDTELDTGTIHDQEVLVLCGASGISKTRAQIIADWVYAGGSLLASGEPGLYDEYGQLHPGGGALKDVLGVTLSASSRRAKPDIYFKLTHQHSALGNLPVGTLVPGDCQVAKVCQSNSAENLAEVFDLGSKNVLGAGITLNHFGNGKSIYINGSLEAYYAAGRVKSQRKLLASMVKFLNGQPLPFEISAPTGVYGLLKENPQGDLLLWLLAPIGFKDAATGRTRQEFVPVENLTVRVRIPAGRIVHHIDLLRIQQDIAFTDHESWQNNHHAHYVEFHIPTMIIGDLVHIALQ